VAGSEDRQVLAPRHLGDQADAHAQVEPEAVTTAQKKWLVEIAGQISDLAAQCERMASNPYNNAAKEKHVRGIFADIALDARRVSSALLCGPPKKETRN
jgi:hypothetical protein